jgi:ADP-ribose pyrophosphatase YjhB (NUDIX family)
MIQDIVDSGRVTFTWIDTVDFGSYSPITQAWGFCLDDEGMLLIGRIDKDSSWLLPGGCPEEAETLEEAFRRETMEELDAELYDVHPLGLMKVDEPDRTHYQARFIARIKRLHKQTPDPCKGKVWERKLIDPKDLLDYMKWKNIGVYLRDKLVDIQKELYSE